MKNNSWQPTLQTKRNLWEVVSKWNRQQATSTPSDYAVIIMHRDEVMSFDFFEPPTLTQWEEWLGFMQMVFAPILMNLHRRLGSNKSSSTAG